MREQRKQAGRHWATFLLPLILLVLLLMNHVIQNPNQLGGGGFFSNPRNYHELNTSTIMCKVVGYQTKLLAKLIQSTRFTSASFYHMALFFFISLPPPCAVVL